MYGSEKNSVAICLITNHRLTGLLAKAAEILQESWSLCHVTHDEMAFSEVISSVWRPCLFSAIGNRCSNETKSIHRIYATKFQRIFGATFAALARGFSDRHFERGEGPGDEVAN